MIYFLSYCCSDTVRMNGFTDKLNDILVGHYYQPIFRYKVWISRLGIFYFHLDKKHDLAILLVFLSTMDISLYKRYTFSKWF